MDIIVPVRFLGVLCLGVVREVLAEPLFCVGATRIWLAFCLTALTATGVTGRFTAFDAACLVLPTLFDVVRFIRTLRAFPVVDGVEGLAVREFAELASGERERLWWPLEWWSSFGERSTPSSESPSNSSSE